MNKRIKKKLLSKQTQYVYGAIGFIIHLSSLIEYNLLQLLAAEKFLSVFDNKDFTYEEVIMGIKDSNSVFHNLSRKERMLGKLIDKLEDTKSFDFAFIEELRKASYIRGYYAHQFFKDDLYKSYMENCPLRYKKRINDDIEFLYQLNCALVQMDKDNRKLVRKIKGAAY